MTESKGDDLAARREWALEQTARDFGISVGELKRRLADKQIEALSAKLAALEASQPTPIDNAAASRWRDNMHQLSEARALRDAKSSFSRAELAEMRSACPDPQLLVRDHRGAPLGPTSEGAIPTSQTVSNVRVGGGTGWGYVAPIKNGIGGGRWAGKKLDEVEMKFEELFAGEIATSLINEPLDLIARSEVEAVSALEKARRSWSEARVIEGRREDAARSNANDKRAKPLRGDLSI
jgi:hypothetical protein